tara:strand:+ start:44 stop:226 length:183 start_codon:yes stop_codon:yes gene_type:complete
MIFMRELELMRQHLLAQQYQQQVEIQHLRVVDTSIMYGQLMVMDHLLTYLPVMTLFNILL